MLASWLLRRPSTGSKLQRFDSADYFAEHRKSGKPTGSAGADSQLVYETQRWLESRAPGLRTSKYRADIALRMTELSKIGVRPSAQEVLDLFSEQEKAEMRRAVPKHALAGFCKDLSQRFKEASCLVSPATKSTSASRASREPITYSRMA